MIQFNQTRSFNVGIAQETSIEAAMIYDDLAYAQQSFGNGYFYRSYEQMEKRFPMLSLNTLRRHVKKLEGAGWISTKVSKVDGVPVCHYQIERFLNAKLRDSKENAKLGDSIYKTTKETTQSSDSVSLVGNSSSDTTARDATRRQFLQAIIEIINPKEKATDERLRLLNGRLKDYTMDEIIDSARAFSQSEWHREHKQMSIDNLLAPSKFGRWYAIRTADGDQRPVVTVENQDEMVQRRLNS